MSTAATTKSSALVPVSEQDFLEQDQEIRGQKFFCMSTISPEDVLLQKDVFTFSKFLQPFAADLDNMFNNLAERFKDDVSVQDMLRNVRERHAYVTKPDELAQELEHFKSTKSTELEAEFAKQCDFRTSVRGIKIRGSFETLREARARAEKLSKTDKSFNVYVGQVGCWCPWSPNPDDVEDQEYAETQLNTLVKKYKEQHALRDEHYAVRQTMLAAAAKAPLAAIVEKPGAEDAPQEDGVATQQEDGVATQQEDGVATQQEDDNSAAAPRDDDEADVWISRKQSQTQQ